MKRKHFWFPCGIKDEPPLDEWPKKDFDILLKETDWEKWLTDSMWRDIIEGNGGANISKLKKRVAEFYVVLNRIRTLNEMLYESAIEEGSRLWKRFWTIQAFGREGLTGDHSWDEIKEAFSE